MGMVTILASLKDVSDPPTYLQAFLRTARGSRLRAVPQTSGYCFSPMLSAAQLDLTRGILDHIPLPSTQAAELSKILKSWL